MKYLDEFRDAAGAEGLLQQIRQRATRPWVLMDVCGGQTHGLIRHGIEQALDGVVQLIHGPGCPVCVTPIDVIDSAIALAMRGDTIVASFGDMLRVPGGDVALIDARGQGAGVQIVYSPIDAVRLAQEHPDKQVIFLAVGFETTAPATALAVLQAESLGLPNFSILSAHVVVQPAMEAIVRSEDNCVEGFLAAGHVCAVTGYQSYRSFARENHVPVVVTGFEPIDLLEGILECVSLLERREFTVVNRYGRSVQECGNPAARQVVNRVYKVVDRPWRGFGVIPDGGLALRDQYHRFDAVQRFQSIVSHGSRDCELCRAAEVLTGKIKPKQCPEFAVRCTPEAPLGAPMVSSEGVCAAYYRFDPIQVARRELSND